MSPDERIGKEPTPIVFDTTVLSNFARSRSISWLVHTTAIPVTVPAVEYELKVGRDEGYQYLQSALDWCRDGEGTPDRPIDEIRIVRPDASTNLPEAVEQLDYGESEALRSAWPDRVLATDDLDARRIAKMHDVGVTGSVGVLADGVEQTDLSVDTADEWLRTWENAGYRSPIESVAELL